MTENFEEQVDVQRYRHFVRKIVQNHFGKPPSRIVYKPTGLSNYVFTVNHIDGQFVVRISSDPEKITAFRQEQRTTEKAREAGVPTSTVIEVGNKIISLPYMISYRVTGEEATHHARRINTVREMGRYAAIINSIKTKGFGKKFDWTEGGSISQTGIGFKTWNEYLDTEWKVSDRLEILAKHRILHKNQLKRLNSIIGEARKLKVKPHLNHGDLRMKNVIVDEDGEITAIVDWEECLSSLAPQWDLSIALHDLTIDEKHEFIEGYGLTHKRFLEMAPQMKAFNILNYAPLIKRAAEEKNDKDLAQYRLRFAGALDLYSLS